MSWDIRMGPYVCYSGGEDGDAEFYRVCPKCGRFVKADEVMTFAGEHQQPMEPNATCSKCGRVAMPFEGYY